MEVSGSGMGEVLWEVEEYYAVDKPNKNDDIVLQGFNFIFLMKIIWGR